MAYQISELYLRYPELQELKPIILQAFDMMVETVYKNGTIFVCGNGGSAADAEHITGELLKSFLIKRKAKDEFYKDISIKYGKEGENIAEKIHPAFKAITLTGHLSFVTAYMNDIDSDTVFAQQIYVLGSSNDLLIVLSTSGNSRNIIKALIVATEIGLKTIAFTGKNGGRAVELANCTIKVPETETYKVQEYHLPIYHALCAMLEEKFYGRKY